MNDTSSMLQYINLGVAIFAMLCLGAFIYYRLWPSMQQQNDEMKNFLKTELSESKQARTIEIAKFSEIVDANAKELRHISRFLEALTKEVKGEKK
jgi:uncharacterized protein HemX